LLADLHNYTLERFDLHWQQSMRTHCRSIDEELKNEEHKMTEFAMMTQVERR